MEPADIGNAATIGLSSKVYEQLIREFIDSGLKCAWVQIPGKKSLVVYNTLLQKIKRSYRDAGIRVIMRGKEAYLWREK